MPDFSETVNSSFPASPSREPAGTFPSTSPLAKPEKMTVKYGQFVLESTGNAELEKIIGDCLAGKMILAKETWNFTKSGETVVTIKYLIPEEPPPAAAGTPQGVKGMRRFKKAQKG